LPEDTCASAYSDTIIVVIRNIVTGSYKEVASLKTYTTRIFTNKCIDEVRKIKEKEATNTREDINLFLEQLPDTARSHVDKWIDKNDERHMLLEKKIKNLNKRHQQVMKLYEDDYSDEEIAKVLEYESAESVKTTRLRCIEKLKEMIFN
jgi:RNA polymerase sigma-70 factor (ECF subfamily)